MQWNAKRPRPQITLTRESFEASSRATADTRSKNADKFGATAATPIATTTRIRGGTASETPGLPSGALLDVALTTALNDTGTAANRQSAPSTGIGSFISQPAFVNVTGAGNLPSGSAANSAGAQGVWLRLTLPAGAAFYKGSADLRTQGSTV